MLAININRYYRFLADWFLLDDTQTYIVSYPKSGRTWLRTLIGKALCDHYGLSEDHLIDTYQLTQQAGLQTTRFSHDKTHLLVGLPAGLLPTHRRPYQNRSVILLLRDPRDLMVSCYFQATKRINVFDQPITTFIKSPRYGIEKYIRWVNSWYIHQSVPRAFLQTTYEAMHATPQTILRQTLNFIGADEVPDSIINDAINYASFSNMKKLEKSDRFSSDVLRPGDQSDPESFKVRKGKVGGYLEYLNEADVAYIQDLIMRDGCPILMAYFEEV